MVDLAECAGLMDDVTAIAIRAAEAIQRSRREALSLKADGSPVTAADEAAEAVICKGQPRAGRAHCSERTGGVRKNRLTRRPDLFLGWSARRYA